MSTRRFVILHHQTVNGEHWDLMIEQSECLATWQLSADPTADAIWPIAATRIADHRKVYLDYEGPISGERGEVSRVAEGECVRIRTTSTSWQFDLHGEHLAGSFELRVGGAAWLLAPAVN